MEGKENNVDGNDNTVTGTDNKVIGGMNTVKGERNVVINLKYGEDRPKEVHDFGNLLEHSNEIIRQRVAANNRESEGKIVEANIGDNIVGEDIGIDSNFLNLY